MTPATDTPEALIISLLPSGRAAATSYRGGIMSRFIKAASPKNSVTLSCGFSMGRGALCRG